MSDDRGADAEIDAAEFRKILGRFPTGVVVVTAMNDDGTPVGMTVGSFASVSLDPALVGFLPDRSSTSFPKIRAAGRFCVNILSADQASICRQFASRAEDKFQGLGWRPGPRTGAPMLEGAVAWIECRLGSVSETGDHFFVLGEVLDLVAGADELPLLFFRGGYGRFSALSMAAWDEAGLLEPLQMTAVARPVMEELSAKLDLEALAIVLRGEEMVVVSSVGNSFREHGVPTRVGARVPLVPPIGSYLVAWDESASDAWLARAAKTFDDPQKATELLQRVRDRGWSVGLMSDRQVAFDVAVSNASVSSPSPAQLQALESAVAGLRPEDTEPELIVTDRSYVIRHIGVPVYGPDGTVLFALAVFGYRSLRGSDIVSHAQQVVAAAGRISALLRQAMPFVGSEFDPVAR